MAKTKEEFEQAALNQRLVERAAAGDTDGVKERIKMGASSLQAALEAARFHNHAETEEMLKREIKKRSKQKWRYSN